jgi:hypothetical protein
VADLAGAPLERAISFGPFRLIPDRRLLLEGVKPVRLGSRALDVLIALVEHPGEVVGKDELMARVWPDTFVEEGNLKFQIGALRWAAATGIWSMFPGAATASSRRSRSRTAHGSLLRRLPQQNTRTTCRPS